MMICFYISCRGGKVYLRAFELRFNFVPVLSYASRGKLGPIIERLYAKPVY